MAPDRDPIINELLPFDEAVSRVKRTRKRVSIFVGTWARFTLQNPAKTAQGIEEGSHGVGALVHVTRKQAVKFLEESFPKHWRSKLSINVSYSKRCLFVGASPR